MFSRQYDIDLREERRVALQRLESLCRAGFISVTDFRTNPLRIFAAHEVAAMCGDGSLGTKMTVQFNLFGGSVLKLGTQRHHGQFLKRMDMIEDVGCFALTELGCVLSHIFLLMATHIRESLRAETCMHRTQCCLLACMPCLNLIRATMHWHTLVQMHIKPFIVTRTVLQEL